MSSVLEDRRSLLAALTGGVALIWVAATRGPGGVASYNVPEVNIAQAQALLEAGATVIDVRDQEKFAYRHLPGAVLVPLVELRVAVPAWLAEVKAKPVVVYCNEGTAHGPEATHLLQAAGFTHVANLASGIEGWAAAGLPVKHG